MSNKEKDVSTSGSILFLLVLINAVIIKAAFLNHENWYWFLLITLPFLVKANYNLRERKQSLAGKQNKTMLHQNLENLN